jgi:endonuclease YncB( thermonuclease family)
MLSPVKLSVAAITAKLTHLQAQGSIDIAQFWPQGESDADTTRLLIDITGKGFTVRKAGDVATQSTKAFNEAYIRGAKKADGSFERKALINSKQQITVRLQRVDAPELHITPGPIAGKSLAGSPWFKRYRQAQAETATVKLHVHLKSMADAQGKVACTFDTFLEARKGPGDAIDKYGRFVGDLLVGPSDENLNLWLLREGWVVVALYDSSLSFEIDDSLSAWRAGRSKGIRTQYRSKFEPFDEQLVYRGAGAAVKPEEAVKYIHPKFFRRYVTWFAHARQGNIKGSFADYLVSKNEQIFDLPNFNVWLKAGSKPADKPATVPLYDRKADGAGISWPPERFIFLEAPSAVFTTKGGVERKLTVADW